VAEKCRSAILTTFDANLRTYRSYISRDLVSKCRTSHKITVLRRRSLSLDVPTTPWGFRSKLPRSQSHMSLKYRPVSFLSAYTVAPKAWYRAQLVCDIWIDSWFLNKIKFDQITCTSRSAGFRTSAYAARVYLVKGRTTALAGAVVAAAY
jgi:hypothetical protein